jgi:hypothetical protein
MNGRPHPARGALRANGARANHLAQQAFAQRPQLARYRGAPTRPASRPAPRPRPRRPPDAGVGRGGPPPWQGWRGPGAYAR